MPRYVKEGATVTLSHGPDEVTVELEVGPACDDNEGHWYCDTHRVGFPHNLAATAHYTEHQETDPGSCQFVWICHHHGPEAHASK